MQVRAWFQNPDGQGSSTSPAMTLDEMSLMLGMAQLGAWIGGGSLPTVLVVAPQNMGRAVVLAKDHPNLSVLVDKQASVSAWGLYVCAPNLADVATEARKRKG